MNNVRDYFSDIEAADCSGKVPSENEHLGRVVSCFTKGYAIGMTGLMILLLSVCSTTATFAQKTVPKLFLDSINNQSIYYYGKIINNSSYSYNEQGRHEYSFYYSPSSYDGILKREHCHCLRDYWDRIIDSNQKYLTEVSEYYINNDVINLKQRTLYDYDDKGKIVRIMHLSQKGAPDMKTTNTYDDNGVLIEFIVYKIDSYGDWYLHTHDRYEYEYDDKGNVTRYTRHRILGFEPPPQPFLREENTYDVDGNLTLKIEYDYFQEWRKRYKYEYKYDSMRRVVESVNYTYWGGNINDWVGMNKKEYTYNANKTVYIIYDAAVISGVWTGWRELGKRDYTYDSMGNLTKTIGYFLFNTATNQWEKSEGYEYAYDSMGNLTRYEAFSGIRDSLVPICDPSVWEYTYLPYSEEDVILPCYDSNDYFYSLQYDSESGSTNTLPNVKEGVKLKGIVSEVKATIHLNPNRKIESTVSYYWNIREVEDTSEVSIKELQGGKVTKLRVYPNPAKNQLTIEYGSSACFGYAQQPTLTAQERPLSEVEVEIYNVMGQKVGTYQFPSFEGAGVVSSSARVVLDAQTTPSYGHPSKGGELAPSLLERAGGEVIIDISHLANGMYYLKVGNKTARFVKE